MGHVPICVATSRPLRTDAGKKGVGPRLRPRHQALGNGEVCLQCMVFPAKRFCLVPSMEGVRWAFSCGTWLPSRAEWLLAVRSIQPEEKERIGQFVFARDAKAAMVLQVFFGIYSIGSRCWGRRAGLWRPHTPALAETFSLWSPWPVRATAAGAAELRATHGLVSTAFVTASEAAMAVKILSFPLLFQMETLLNCEISVRKADKIVFFCNECFYVFIFKCYFFSLRGFITHAYSAC